MSMNATSLCLRDIDFLFAPFVSRKLVLSSRLVMSPVQRFFALDGVPTVDMLRYYCRRAAHGVGLILTEPVAVPDAVSALDSGMACFYGGAAFRAWRRIARLIHTTTCSIAPLLTHAGMLHRKISAAKACGPSTLPLLPGMHGSERMSHARIEEVAEAFELLSTQGKVKYFGVSNENPMQIQLLQKYLGDIRLYINQLQLSITNTGIIDSGLNVNTEKNEAIDRDGYVLDFCRLNDITIQPWSPLQHGFFGGTFIGNSDYDALNKKLNEIGEKYGITATSTAILWLLRHSACMQPIIGTVNTDRIRDIAKGADFDMSRKEWYELYKSTGKTLP